MASTNCTVQPTVTGHQDFFAKIPIAGEANVVVQVLRTSTVPKNVLNLAFVCANLFFLAILVILEAFHIYFGLPPLFASFTK